MFPGSRVIDPDSPEGRPRQSRGGLVGQSQVVPLMVQSILIESPVVEPFTTSRRGTGAWPEALAFGPQAVVRLYRSRRPISCPIFGFYQLQLRELVAKKEYMLLTG